MSKEVKRRTVYAGSFDPLTNGHLWMIEQGARMFNELVVAIGLNPDKKSAFSLEDRLAMIREATKHLPNVKADYFQFDLLVNYAKRIGAGHMLRGIRSVADYEYERSMRYLNERFGPGIVSAFLMPPAELADVSSSLVKGLILPRGGMRGVQSFVPRNVYVKMLEKYLYNRFKRFWEETATRGKVLEETIQAAYDGLVRCFAEPQRAYHNLTHIADCLSELDEVQSLGDQDRQEIEWAVWYHDAIYFPERKDNEEESARLFEMTFSPWLPAERVRRAADMILATKTHVAQTPAQAAMLDIDLSILGRQPVEFQEFENGIRYEYQMYGDELYYPRRKGILRGFHDHEPIFKTVHFQEKYGTQAIVNLRKYIMATPNELREAAGVVPQFQNQRGNREMSKEVERRIYMPVLVHPSGDCCGVLDVTGFNKEFFDRSSRLLIPQKLLRADLADVTGGVEEFKSVTLTPVEWHDGSRVRGIQLVIHESHRYLIEQHSLFRPLDLT